MVIDELKVSPEKHLIFNIQHGGEYFEMVLLVVIVVKGDVQQKGLQNAICNAEYLEVVQGLLRQGYLC